ncbi:SirB2 family protein [Bacterioplanoides pacificum]|uniref:SirB2 family protein n=1 Tax=Bacterioplanoides pacificum TaxID=1171596 RepID=A0ABV7VQ69_9GAMM
MEYTALKHSHAGLAYLSGLLFFIRFFLFKVSPGLRSNKLLKILPHVIDTILLVFAVMLCLQIAQYPLTHLWLSAKVVGLLAYIGFGVVAIKRGSWPAFIAAMLSFGYILGAAKAHNALSWLVFF